MFESRWWVAFAAAWINFYIFAIFRSAGVFYLSFISTFGCSHQQAAWPISLAGSIASTVGLAAGFSSHYLSLRSLIVFGIFVASTSVIITFYATSIQFVTLTIGLLQGIGIGFVTCLLPAVLNKHFPDKKSVALGISYAGATLGAFIFPVLIHHMLKHLGLHETTLIIGFFSTFGLFGTYFLTSGPNDGRSHDNDSSKNSSNIIRMTEFASVSQALPSGDSTKHRHSSPGISLRTSPGVINTNQRPLIQECETIVYVENNKLYSNITDNGERSHGSCDTSSNSSLDDLEDETDGRNRRNDSKCRILKKFIANIKHDYKVVSNFPFLLVTFSYINFILDFVAFIIVLPDIANDRGIDESHAKWLLSIFSITDLIGRLMPGWLSYCRVISDKNIYILSLTFLGLSMALIIIVKEWSHFVALTLVCGFATGCQMVLSPVMLADYLGNENTAISFGLANFVCGIVTLVTRPMIIGSKDIYGNYNMLSYILSLTTIGAGLIWLIESIIAFRFEEPPISAYASRQQAIQ